MQLRVACVAIGISLLAATPLSPVIGQGAEPTLVDGNLTLERVATGLALPTSIAFVGEDDFLVLEKDSGQVKRVSQGEVVGTVLDLRVNSFSERGLLGIALQPGFTPTGGGVYLFWSCVSTALPADPFFPDEDRCLDANMFGPDSNQVLQVPLLGNRVDRFVWDGSALTYDHNLIMLRSFQNDAAPVPPDQGDAAQPARGNHDAGVITFGPDGKLYVIFGDVGRRGALQNLPCGPSATTCEDQDDVTDDDQFGGPEPDDAHLAGVILRLNPDGTAPSDNPFFAVGAAIGGAVGTNVQKIFAYGIRNSFGMAFDPVSDRLWMQENGEDAFDEISLVEPGLNSGWIQAAGPLSRIADYRAIETTSTHHEDFPNLQQFRWGPENIALTAAAARARLFMLPGAHYSDPEFSWKWVVAPAAIGFVDGGGLGPQYAGDMLVGVSVPEPQGGVLFRLNLTGNRRKIAVDDRRLEDRVADNVAPHELTESESLIFGTNFGVVTDIETAPDGSVYIVSLDQGTVYRISR